VSYLFTLMSQHYLVTEVWKYAVPSYLLLEESKLALLPHLWQTEHLVILSFHIHSFFLLAGVAVRRPPEVFPLVNFRIGSKRCFISFTSVSLSFPDFCPMCT